MADEMRDLLRKFDRRLASLERRAGLDGYYVHAQIARLVFEGDDDEAYWEHGQGTTPVAWWANPVLEASLVVVTIAPVANEQLCGYHGWSGFSTRYTGTLSTVHCFGVFPR